jgi:hypothetical protein
VTGTTGADPYSDPATGVLRNRLGITSADELAQAEAALSASRLIELERRQLPGSYDLDHLRGFHRIILGDVYDWAGEPRTVSIAKGSVFCLPQHLASSAADIFGTPGTTSTGSAWTPPATSPPAPPRITATSRRCAPCSTSSSTCPTRPDHPPRLAALLHDPALDRAGTSPSGTQPTAMLTLERRTSPPAPKLAAACASRPWVPVAVHEIDRTCMLCGHPHRRARWCHGTADWQWRSKMTATLKMTHKAIGVEVRRGTYDIVVDGQRAGSLEMNDTIEIPVEPGRHTLQIRSGRNSSRTQAFEAAESQTVAFRCTGKSFLPIFLASFVVPSLALQLRREADDRSL